MCYMEEYIDEEESHDTIYRGRGSRVLEPNVIEYSTSGRLALPVLPPHSLACHVQVLELRRPFR